MGGQGKLQTSDWKGQEEEPERALRKAFGAFKKRFS